MSQLGVSSVVYVDSCTINKTQSNLIVLQEKTRPIPYLSPSKYTYIFQQKVFSQQTPMPVLFLLNLIFCTLCYILLALLLLSPNLCITVVNLLRLFLQEEEKDELQTLKTFLKRAAPNPSLPSASVACSSSFSPASPLKIEERAPSEVLTPFSVVGDNFTILRVNPSKKRTIDSEKLFAERLVNQKTTIDEFSSDQLLIPKDESLAQAPLASQKKYEKFQRLFSSIASSEKKKYPGQLSELLSQYFTCFLNYEIKLALLLYSTPFLQKNCQKIFNAWSFILDKYYSIAYQCLSLDTTTFDALKLENSLNAYLKTSQISCKVEKRQNSDKTWSTIQVARNSKFLFCFYFSIHPKNPCSLETFYFPKDCG